MKFQPKLLALKYFWENIQPYLSDHITDFFHNIYISSNHKSLKSFYKELYKIMV